MTFLSRISVLRPKLYSGDLDMFTVSGLYVPGAAS